MHRSVIALFATAFAIGVNHPASACEAAALAHAPTQPAASGKSAGAASKARAKPSQPTPVQWDALDPRTIEKAREMRQREKAKLPASVPAELR